MSGHSKWSKVKHQKAVEDAKKGERFSKIAKEIAIAAKDNPDAQANPALKAVVEKARSINMPKENIERAIDRAKRGSAGEGEAFLLEAYARNGEALMVKGFTDNKNRALSEVRHILLQYGAKLVGPGGVSWNFEGALPKATKPASKEITSLIKALEAHPDVIKVLTDAV